MAPNATATSDTSRLEAPRPAVADRQRIVAVLIRRLELSAALPTFPAEDADEITDALLAAGLFRDEHDVKAEAIHEAAAVQRQLANASATRDGRWEHEQLADWLDEYAGSAHHPNGAPR